MSRTRPPLLCPLGCGAVLTWRERGRLRHRVAVHLERNHGYCPDDAADDAAIYVPVGVAELHPNLREAVVGH